MPARPRPPVRLISFPAAPIGTDGAAEVRPDPFRHPRGAPPQPQSRPQSRPRPPLRAVPADEGKREADLTAIAVVIARALAEVIAGLRPLHHLAGRVTPEVYERLARIIPPTAPAPAPARLDADGRSLRVSVPFVQEPVPGVAEACAVVFTGRHAQALALRLERCRGRWRCAAVETTLALRHFRAHRPRTAA